MGKIFGYLKNQLKNELYDEWGNDIIFKQLSTIDQSNLINTYLTQQILILCEKRNHIAVHSYNITQWEITWFKFEKASYDC